MWAGFYERLFNFREVRYFDIEGKLTGLKSKAMTSPDGKIRIPINESSDDKSQIEEYLAAYHGEGIQHIALATETSIARWKRCARGVAFMTVPTPITRRSIACGPWRGLPAEARPHPDRRRPRRGPGLLLQIFTDTPIGPIFFEIIQRKGNEALARAISGRCSNPSSATRSAAACSRRPAAPGEALDCRRGHAALRAREPAPCRDPLAGCIPLLPARSTASIAAAPLDDDAVAAIEAGMDEYEVVPVFRGQELTDVEQIAFTRHFGELEAVPERAGMCAGPRTIASAPASPIS